MEENKENNRDSDPNESARADDLEFRINNELGFASETDHE